MDKILSIFVGLAITAGIAYVLVTWPRIVIITVIAVYAAITLIGVLSRVRHKLGHGLDRGHSQRHSVDNYAPTATDKSDESGESEATDEPDELDSADALDSAIHNPFKKNK
jgi:hypothetical protein